MCAVCVSVFKVVVLLRAETKSGLRREDFSEHKILLDDKEKYSRMEWRFGA